MAEFTPLSTSYQDDILSSSNTRRKYTQVSNSDGTVSFEDKTQYDQEGSLLSAGDMNRTNQAINGIYANRIVDLEDLALVTETGFFVDAKPISDIYKETVTELESVATSYGLTVLHKKIGNLHTIRIAGTLSGALTTHKFTIPTECAPTQTVYENVRVGKIWCEIQILSTGSVTITADSTVTGSQYINKWITYV